jgi:antitoxin component of MazEF toxin-antitoxin module
MKTAIRKMGNSQGVLIPKPLLAELGVGPNDPVDIKVKKGTRYHANREGQSARRLGRGEQAIARRW